MIKRALIALLLLTVQASASVTVVVNGVNYTIPQVNERGWGQNVTSWIQAISANTLQPLTGTFTLGADIDFGASFGLKSAYYKSRSANIAATGQFRLANADSISFRNSGNSADIALKPDADGFLQYNSIDLVNLSGTQTLTNKVISGGSNTISSIADGSLSTSYIKADGSRAFTGAVIVPEISTPSTPASNTVQIYAKSGHTLNFQGSDGVEQQVQTVSAAGVPSGTVTFFAGSSAPAGYLLGYGQAVSRATYATLFGVISTTYGAGDGSTTFNLPDCRGRALAGKDDMGGSAANRITNGGSGLDGTTLGAAGGAQNRASNVSATVPAHFHGKGTLNITAGGAHVHAAAAFGFLDDHSGAGTSGFTTVGGGDLLSIQANTASATHTHPSGEFAGSVGNTAGSNGDSAFNATVTNGTMTTLQPTIIFNCIIKQ